MPKLRPLEETGFDPDLHLPIGGKTYTIVSPDFEESKRIRALISDTGLPTVEQVYEAVKVLGDGVVEQMIVDKVPSTALLHAGRTALLHFGFSPDMGKIHWELGQLGSQIDIETLGRTMSPKGATD